MSRYLITIAPDNGGGESAHTTVRVDTSTGRTRITELTVRSASDSGLAPADLPAIDMDLLIRALTATRPAQPLALEPANFADTREAARPEAAADEPTSVEPATTPARRRGRKAAAKAAPAKKATARKSVGRKATTAKATAAKKATATKTPSRRVSAAAAPAATGTRAYRRMPDPEQVMDAYRQAGTIGGVAEHFDVPRHTVAGWARRLRTLGHTIGRQ